MFSTRAFLSRVGVVAASLAPLTAQAQGDLLIAPTRIVLDGRQGGEVILSNIGDSEATYRIELELRRMDGNGALSAVPREAANEKETAALAMVRYAPRRITLPPNQPQSVRISARPGAELPEGEYRVHMSFTAIPAARPVTQGEDPQGIEIRLVPIYGVTIPVFVRHGRLEAQVSIANPALRAGASGSELTFDLIRNGSSSTYGEVVIRKPGQAEPIAVTRGVAIYTEVASRKLALPLSPEQTAALRGPVEIEYRELPENGGRLLASLTTTIG